MTFGSDYTVEAGTLSEGNSYASEFFISSKLNALKCASLLFQVKIKSFPKLLFVKAGVFWWVCSQVSPMDGRSPSTGPTFTDLPGHTSRGPAQKLSSGDTRQHADVGCCCHRRGALQAES